MIKFLAKNTVLQSVNNTCCIFHKKMSVRYSVKFITFDDNPQKRNLFLSAGKRKSNQ